MINNKENLEFVTLNRRLIALSIDIFGLSLVLFPLYFFIVWLSEKLGVNLLSSIWVVLVVNFISICISCTYFLYFWIKYSTSPGKFIMQCKIVDKKNLTNISPKQAITRLFGLIITLGIGMFLADFNKKRQGLHDKISSTVVIKVNKKNYK